MAKRTAARPWAANRGDAACAPDASDLVWLSFVHAYESRALRNLQVMRSEVDDLPPGCGPLSHRGQTSRQLPTSTTLQSPPARSNPVSSGFSA